MLRPWSLSALAFVAAVAGCATYEEKPLEAEEVLQQVRRARLLEQPAGHEPGALGFPRAAELLRDHGPSLRNARAAHETALALAGVDTPLPNPGVDVGPLFGFGPAVVERHVQPFGSLSFAIPLGGRLGRQDDLNRVSAEVAGVELTVRHREAYLALRRAWIRCVIARRRLASGAASVKLAADSAALGKRLVDAGQATALDVAQLELDAARAGGVLFDARLSEADAVADLSRITGIAPETLGAPGDDGIPGAVPELPSMDEIAALLVANQASLARIRSKYGQAEAELRLEISKQYPDVRFGLNGQGDPGETKGVIGLTLGIDIPIFDRNQQGIATALAKREQVRAEYESACRDALAAAEKARARLGILLERRASLNVRVMELARRQMDLAQKGLEAGSIGALQALEAERSYRGSVLEALQSEQDAWDAWMELEDAVGRPLFALPGEDPVARPSEPIGSGHEGGAK